MTEKTGNTVAASHGSVAVGGDANQAVFNLGDGNAGHQQINNAEAAALLGQLLELTRASGLPSADKDKVARHLETARDEAEAAEPDKPHAAKSLEKAATILKESGEVVDGTLSLWEKAQPIFVRLGPWLAAAGIGLGL